MWRERSLCSRMTADFFGEEGAGSREALRLCGLCLVEAECLAYALEHEEFGVWGGTTETDRRRMRTRRSLGVEA